MSYYRDETLTEKIMMKKITVTLTPAQMREILDAVSQMTDGNAYDYREMKKQRAGKRLKSIQVPAFQVCEQELSFFLARALRMSLRRWRAST